MKRRDKPDWFQGIISNKSPDISAPINHIKGGKSFIRRTRIHWNDVIYDPERLRSLDLIKKATKNTLSWQDILRKKRLSDDQWFRFRHIQEYQKYEEIVFDFFHSRILMCLHLDGKKKKPSKRHHDYAKRDRHSIKPVTWSEIVDNPQRTIVKHWEDLTRGSSVKNTTKKPKTKGKLGNRHKDNITKILNMEKTKLFKLIDKNIEKNFRLCMQILAIRYSEFNEDEIKELLSKGLL